MSGTHRSTTRTASSPAEGGARRGRALMAAGVLLGTLMLAGAGALMGDAFSSPGLDPVHWPHDASRTSGDPEHVAVGSERATATPLTPTANPTANPTATTRPTQLRTGPAVTGSTPQGVRPEGGRGTRKPRPTTSGAVPGATPGAVVASPGRTPAASPSWPSSSPSHGSRPSPAPTPSWSAGPVTTAPSHPHGTPPGRHPSRTHQPGR
ncbi:hypothetical protein ABT158_06595 [Nonomuraea sp. NPDC001636]|uniref:hypothetical protein n=1 Tax=Nonomuraea sp. NPDC001636 TaxID=3154391 RepID=UPI003320F767